MSQVDFFCQLLREEEVSGVQIVSFSNKDISDEQDVQQLGEELMSLLDGPCKVIVNFSNVQRLSSAALGKLIGISRRVRAAQGELRLCCLPPNIMRVFNLMKLDQLFEIYDDQAAALEGF